MYDARGIADIKQSGQLSNYIAMERALIAKLDGAMLADVEPGKVALAHLIGYYGASECGVEASLQSHDWHKEWSIKGFVSRDAALAYARAAVCNALTKQAADVMSKARAGLAQLEAAQ